MKFFLLLDLWLALLTGAPQHHEINAEPPPPPTEQAAGEDKDDDSSSRPWYGFLWVGPSINNGY